MESLGVVRGITVRSRSIVGNIFGALQSLFGGNITIYTERGEGGTSVGRGLALLAAGRIAAEPLVSHRFPLSRVHEAFEVLEKRVGDPMKVIINP